MLLNFCKHFATFCECLQRIWKLRQASCNLLQKSGNCPVARGEGGRRGWMEGVAGGGCRRGLPDGVAGGYGHRGLPEEVARGSRG